MVIDWRTDTGVLVAWDGDTIAARVYKDGCEWLAVGAVPPSAFKLREEAMAYVERQWQQVSAGKSDDVSSPVGAGAGHAE